MVMFWTNMATRSVNPFGNCKYEKLGVGRRFFFSRLHSACSEGGLAEKSGRFSGLHGLRRNTRRERIYHRWTSFWKAPVGKCQEHGGFFQAEKWDTWPEKLWLSHWKWMGYMVSSGMMLCKCIILGRKQQTSGVDDLCFLWDLVRFFFEYVQAPYDWGNLGDRPRGILGVNQPPHQMRCGWPPWVLWLVGGLNLPIFQCG